ncbi:MAG: TetR/AcrR family transcriptional regulator [Treponema sp.]|nr:TetR/AcrR family transcriptional regulator [Treponema sp.]MCL2252462.1 TetR/AcrR family transcriptional regulator [Treponema sp.]
MSKNEKSSDERLPNRQVQRTCSWIFEALLLLMDEKPYDKITVTDIIEKAGIARQTFYRNFKDKNEVIVKYFTNIFNSELLTIENINKKDKQENIILTFNIKYMINHRANIKKLLTIVGIKDLFTDSFTEWHNMLFNQKKNKLNKEAQLVYWYKIHYQITGIIIVIMDWFKNDMPLPVSNLVRLLNFYTVDTKTIFSNVPNIKIKIIDN